MTTPALTPTAKPAPRFITVKLPKFVDVTQVRIDPGAICGDPDNASTKGYKIEVSKNNVSWTKIKEASFSLAQGQAGVLQPAFSGLRRGVRYVRFTVKSNFSAGQEFIDIAEVARLGKEAGARLIVDNVFATPILQRPMELGADIVLYSATKHIDGQGRCLGGVILASEERARTITDRPVWIRGTGQVLDGFQLTSLHEDYAHWPALKRAGEAAYRMAGIEARDVDVAEVHDCFTIAELIACEELGFCPKGEGGPFVQTGRSDYGGDVVVNPRGGLIGCGHPLGATGVAQAVEIFQQLREEAGGRQVPAATVGLTHNNSGMGEHVVMIYGREAA